MRSTSLFAGAQDSLSQTGYGSPNGVASTAQDIQPPSSKALEATNGEGVTSVSGNVIQMYKDIPHRRQEDSFCLSHGGPFQTKTHLVSAEYGSPNEPSSTNLEARKGKGVEDTQDVRQDIASSQPTRSSPGTQDGLSQVTQDDLSEGTQGGLSQARLIEPESSGYCRWV